MVPKKLCSDCGIEKPANIKYFEVCHRNEDNLRDWCLDCGKERSKKINRENSRKYRSNNPEHARSWARNNRALHLRRSLFNKAKSSAKKRGLAFEITLNDIPDIPKVCPVFGFPLVVGNGIGRRSPNGPSLDRIDSTKGYIPGNLQVISWRANELKRDGTLEEFEMLVAHWKSLSQQTKAA